MNFNIVNEVKLSFQDKEIQKSYQFFRCIRSVLSSLLKIKKMITERVFTVYILIKKISECGIKSSQQ